MRSARIAGLVVALSLAVTGIGSSQTADSPVQLKDVSIDRASGGASVTVKTSGPAQYEAKLIDSPSTFYDPGLRHKELKPVRFDIQVYQNAKYPWPKSDDQRDGVRGKGVDRTALEAHRPHGIHALHSGPLDTVAMASDLQPPTDQSDRLRDDR